MVRTRFAPSPTGFLHIGGARTALFAWAFARKHRGEFVLRIEDTDLERSTRESTQAILDSMLWLNLDWDQGPFHQMQRLERYRQVAQQLLKDGHAYHCYASREELEEMRNAQRARGEKPRYDGRWRDSREAPPAGVKPVVRFKNPLAGTVAFDDLVKGAISVENSELDDLVILRSDGVPTYNFGAVVDDLDMDITHVIRGDDHVNNTPRQVNIIRALNAPLPQYAHVPMILGSDGERLSKRHGAVSVMQYRESGYLPEAMLNYLARLGWSHGNAEIFSREQFIEWFDLAHISRSPAQFNPEKLAWLNHQYLKKADNARLADDIRNRLDLPRTHGPIGLAGGPDLAAVVGLLKERAQTLKELADAAMLFYADSVPGAELLAKHVTPEVQPALAELAGAFAKLPEWEPETVNGAIKAALDKHNLPMPKIAMPLRAMVFGQTQTPPIDAALAVMGRERVLQRMKRYLS